MHVRAESRRFPFHQIPYSAESIDFTDRVVDTGDIVDRAGATKRTLTPNDSEELLATVFS